MKRRAETFYLAMNSEYPRAAQSVAGELVALGLRWSYDWTPHLRELDHAWPHLTEQDLRGAVSADLFVLMAYPQTMGGMLELGARLEHERNRNKPLDCPRSTHVVLSPTADEDPRVLDKRMHFFFYHRSVTCVHDSWAAFLDWIAKTQEEL